MLLYLIFQKMTPEPEKEKTKMINNIKTLYAVNLFCLHKFEDSMKIFVALDTGITWKFMEAHEPCFQGNNYGVCLIILELTLRVTDSELLPHIW